MLPELAGQHDLAHLLVLALGGADQMAYVTVPPSAAARNEAASAMFLMLLLSTRVAPLPGGDQSSDSRVTSSSGDSCYVRVPFRTREGAGNTACAVAAEVQSALPAEPH